MTGCLPGAWRGIRVEIPTHMRPGCLPFPSVPQVTGDDGDAQELIDTRPQVWDFARGPLPAGLPVRQIQGLPWFLLGVRSQTPWL